jgi:hypothetical protein
LPGRFHFGFRIFVGSQEYSGFRRIDESGLVTNSAKYGALSALAGRLS